MTTPVALLLPGRRYSVDHPVMWVAASVARELGWRTQAVSWAADDVSDETVLDIGRAALDELPPGSVVIGKSLGSLLLPDAAERGVPGVWLTPVLSHRSIRAGIDLPAPMLLVGGTADDMWDSAAAHACGHEVLEFPDANHLLEVDGDAVRSAGLLPVLAASVRDFLLKVR